MSSKAQDQNQRVQRVAKAIRDIVAQAVIRGLGDVPRGPVTITRVDVTRDFKSAKVFVSIFVPDGKSERAVDEFVDGILEAFDNSKRELSGLVNKQLRLKYIPVFEFVHDTGLEKMSRLAATLESINQSQKSETSAVLSGDDEE